MYIIGHPIIEKNVRTVPEKKFVKNNTLKSASFGIGDVELQMLIQECGGVSIAKGLYRVHTADTCMFWSKLLNKYFPNYGWQLYPFGFDWLGRQYCINISKKRLITMLDPSTVQGYDIEGEITLFHNKDMVDDKEETVSESSFYVFLKALSIDKI